MLRLINNVDADYSPKGRYNREELKVTVYRFLNLNKRYMEIEDDGCSIQSLLWRLRSLKKKENIKNLEVHLFCKNKVVLENTNCG